MSLSRAGFTGLWTAYYLARQDPALRIILCEREIAGFGASGRNGGWCSALFPASAAKLARMSGRDAAIAMQRAMQETVNEVGRVAAAEAIDCHFDKGGTVMLARPPAQRAPPAFEARRSGRNFPGVVGTRTLLAGNGPRGTLVSHGSPDRRDTP